MSTTVLILVIAYLCVSMWDVVRVNHVFGKFIQPGPDKRELARRRAYDAWLESGATWRPDRQA